LIDVTTDDQFVSSKTQKLSSPEELFLLQMNHNLASDRTRWMISHCSPKSPSWI